MSTITETLPYAQINELLEMVQIFNGQIKRSLALGKSETSLDIRQSKYLRDKHLKELHTLLLQYDIDLQALSV